MERACGGAGRLAAGGVVWLPLLVALVGCGTGGRVPVTGTVLLDGQPVKGAIVEFHPEASGAMGSGGFGVCDGTGFFRMKTPQGRPGIHPGRYRVTVSRFVVDPATQPTAEQVQAMTPEERIEYERKALALFDSGVGELFGGYANAQSSPLVETVAPGQKPLKLDLKSGKRGS